MRLEATAAFEEVRKVQLKEIKKSEESKDVSSADDTNTESKVAQENSRALSVALNNKEFKANIEKVERLKNEIENGQYQPDSEKIAKRLIISEKRGDFYLGIIKT